MLQPNKFRIYNASAGSGKTFTLVQEFLSLLLVKPNPDAFKELLAITFTNKAANEMKSRILDMLKHLSTAEDEDSRLVNFSKETGLSVDVIRTRSGKILSSILHNYGLFAVSTIDKFNLRLMRAFSQDLGLSVNFDVQMEEDTLLSESVDVLFSELHQNPQLAGILSEIAIENLSNDERWDISGDIVSQTKTLLNDKYLQQMKLLHELPLEKFNAFRAKVNNRYFSAKNVILQTGKDLIEYFDSQGLTINDFKKKSQGSIFKYFQMIAEEVYKPMSDAQKKMLEDGSYLSNKTADHIQVTGKIHEAYEKILNGMSEMYLWKGIRQKINPVTVINEVDKKFSAIKNENNILMISEFNRIIGESIADQPAPFVYEKIGNRYTNYFIDEFQDTSDLQWDNLLPLMENAVAQDHTVMIVGDPKQSIYRWRGGNPQLMLHLSQHPDDQYEVVNLPTNWRSYDKVISFNNALYDFISNGLACESYQELYRGASQNCNERCGGYVQLRLQPRPPNGSGESLIEHCMLGLLKDIQKAEENGFTWDEMAVLVRKKTDAQNIAEFLTENGYQIISSDSLLLKNSDDVLLLMAFIRYLANPGLADYRAELLIRLFHSELIQKEDISAFFIGCAHLSQENFLSELKKEGVNLTGVTLPFQSFYDQVSGAVRAFRLNEKGNSYITFFMDEVLKFQNQPDPTALNFAEHWDLNSNSLSIIIPEGQKAIQLMTIHKSKGLEFPVVFIPYVTWQPKQSGVWIKVDDDEIPVFFVDPIKEKEFLPQEVRETMDDEENQSELDELNALYVASTRAVEQLYITTVAQENGKPVASYLNAFAMNYDRDEDGVISFGDPQRVSEPEEISTENQQEIPFISSDWNHKVQISREHAFLWNESRAEAVEFGNKIHAVLEKLENSGQTEELLERFELQGFITSEDRIKIQSGLKDIFEHPLLTGVFDTSEYLNEREFISEQGQLFRPDRLAKVNGDWVLVDYKTGKPEIKHADQILHYAHMLQPLGINVARKLLVYPGSAETVVEVN